MISRRITNIASAALYGRDEDFLLIDLLPVVLYFFSFLRRYARRVRPRGFLGLYVTASSSAGFGPRLTWFPFVPGP